MQGRPVFPTVRFDTDFCKLAAVNGVDIRCANTGVDNQLILPRYDAQYRFAWLHYAANRMERKIDNFA